MIVNLNNELILLEVDLSLFISIRVYDTFGLGALIDFKFIKFLSKFDTVFTIFGPLYSWRKPSYSFVGFAQPWIIYPNNEVYKGFRFHKKIQIKFKYFLQSYFFYRGDEIIVELEHVKTELSKHKVSKKIHIVNNCVSSIFNNKDRWADIRYTRSDNDVTLGIVSRDYPHKNLNILKSIVH